LKGGIGKLEGQASFMLGKAYEEAGDLQTALQCYSNFYELSKQNKDSEDYGQAAEACAKCHQK
jgi:cytochrome c-type biogenesis protein CcmH/NrfG